MPPLQESEEEGGDEDGEGDEDESDDEEEEETEEQMEIRDETETNLVNLRRTIYLTIMSSVDFEEAGHKLLKIHLAPGQEVRLGAGFRGMRFGGVHITFPTELHPDSEGGCGNVLFQVGVLHILLCGLLMDLDIVPSSTTEWKPTEMLVLSLVLGYCGSEAIQAAV